MKAILRNPENGSFWGKDLNGKEVSLWPRDQYESLGTCERTWYRVVMREHDEHIFIVQNIDFN